AALDGQRSITVNHGGSFDLRRTWELALHILPPKEPPLSSPPLPPRHQRHDPQQRWLLDVYGNKPVPVADVAPHAVPWSCLASCPTACRFGRYPWEIKREYDLPRESPGTERAADAATLVARLRASSLREQFHLQTTAEWSSTTGIHDEPPWYVPLRDDPPDDIDTAWGVSHDRPPRFVVALYREQDG
ncbi:hypothetical protein, partial [Nocardia amamiensis]|uniref:hypothetical protein n=1 Tax=Nocardia amamiensis TaxID=404578 RepID=UPI0033CD2E7C